VPLVISCNGIVEVFVGCSTQIWPLGICEGLRPLARGMGVVLASTWRSSIHCHPRLLPLCCVAVTTIASTTFWDGRPGGTSCNYWNIGYMSHKLASYVIPSILGLPSASIASLWESIGILCRLIWPHASLKHSSNIMWKLLPRGLVKQMCNTTIPQVAVHFF
jgi:hypothetical protein